MALNADVAQMLSAAGQLKNIESEVLTALGRYQTMNQNLHGAGFDGDVIKQHGTEDGPANRQEPEARAVRERHHRHVGRHAEHDAIMRCDAETAGGRCGAGGAHGCWCSDQGGTTRI